MYQQPNASYTSTHSLRRLSSNNPFRHLEQPQHSNHSSNSVSSLGNNPHFNDWVQRNKQIVDSSSDEDLDDAMRTSSYLNGASNRGGSNASPSFTSSPPDFQKPKFPAYPTRTGSDSSVNYSPRKMSSNNPFASAMNDGKEYVHHREPPPVPRTSKGVPPPRPPKSDSTELPTYEEAAGVERAQDDYSTEKRESPSRRHHSSRPHRSQSDSTRYRSHREKGESHRSSRRHRSHKEKSESKKKPQPVKAKNMDTIDKLDVTGFFGGGFHHDGPFDACTPHRNKNSKAAPVMAFPVDGPNNSIKGMPANNSTNEQMKLAFGNYDEDQNEIVGSKVTPKPIAAAPGPEPVPLIKTNKKTNDVGASLFVPKHDPSVMNFDVNAKAIPVHGSTSAGLGSSTFVDGAPAPKATLNDDFLGTSNGGLTRKKSLVQRLRGNSSSEAGSARTSSETAYSRPDGVRSPSNGYDSDDDYGASNSGTGSSLLRRVKSLKVRK